MSSGVLVLPVSIWLGQLGVAGYEACGLMLLPSWPCVQNSGSVAAVASACSFRVVFQALCGVFTNLTLVEQGFVVSIWNSLLLLVLRLMVISSWSSSGASYARGDLGIPGIRGNKENLTFPWFIINGRERQPVSEGFRKTSYRNVPGLVGERRQFVIV